MSERLACSGDTKTGSSQNRFFFCLRGVDTNERKETRTNTFGAESHG